LPIDSIALHLIPLGIEKIKDGRGLLLQKSAQGSLAAVFLAALRDTNQELLNIKTGAGSLRSFCGRVATARGAHTLFPAGSK